MEECTGILVIALERIYFENGFEKRGGEHENTLTNIKVATPWNQIESAMAYAKGIPILIILEEGVKNEGLLEKGHDWYVMTVKAHESSLTTTEFNGVVSSWKEKVIQHSLNKGKKSTSLDLANLTIGQLVSCMKPSQLWSILAALAALMTGIFIIGTHFPAK
jgi:hypothetical protein